MDQHHNRGLQWSKTHGTFMMKKMNSILEAVNGAWEVLLQVCKVAEAFNYDIEVPCVVQWRMWCYSAPTSLNNDLLNDEIILENTTEWSKWPPTHPSRDPKGEFTRRRLPSWKHRGWVWKPEKEMNGWYLGRKPDLLRMMTTDKTLNLKVSETIAVNDNGTAI